MYAHSLHICSKGVQLYLLQLFKLGILEPLQCVSVFLLHVTQACVTDLITHFPDVYQ